MNPVIGLFSWRLGCVFVVGCLAGCGRTSAPAAISKADSLVLYEGLPHQTMEPELLAKEKQNKPFFTRHEFPFYQTPLEVTPEDVEKLKALLGNEKSFEPWRGEKKCGGFHPDFLAEWRVGEKTYDVLICFGCQEVKLISPGQNDRHDIENGANKQLQEILRKYLKNRPGKPQWSD